MLFERPTDDILYDALISRDAAYEGFAWAAVKTTGVFCRLTCPARILRSVGAGIRGTILEAMDQRSSSALCGFGLCLGLRHGNPA
jgi:AraC family transcriptional regulator of adaptative response/methylated-DNA-[protein]-cysteine methyltransferase